VIIYQKKTTCSLLKFLRHRWHGMYGWCRSIDVNLLQASMSRCIGDLWSWTHSNRLQLSATNVVSSAKWGAPDVYIPISDKLLCNEPVHPVQSVRDIGVYVDGAMTHIDNVLSSGFSALRSSSGLCRHTHDHSGHHPGTQSARLL